MPGQRIPVERVQTGVRMEKRLVKVLKALAEYHDVTLGDLLEGIVLHAFEGKLFNIVVSAWLDKAEAHAQAKKFEPSVFLSARACYSFRFSCLGMHGKHVQSVLRG